MASRDRSGFTLLEVIFSMALIGLLLGLGILNFRSKIAREGTRGLALALASELRAARARAVTQQTFVGVCFPNEDETNPVSSSVALREGVERSSLRDVHHFDQDFDAGIFVGTWPVTGTPMGAPSTGPSLISSLTGLDPALWTGTRDYCLIFGPDGTVTSRGLPTLDGEFAFLVGNSFSHQPGSEDWFEVTAVGDPMTVLVSNSGSVRVESGASGASSLPTPGDPLALARPPTLPGSGTGTAPEIAELEAFPSHNPSLPNTSLSQTYIEIHPDGEGDYGLATFQIKATDIDGGPLFFEARCSASDDSEHDFSTPSKGRMEWIDGYWQATVCWRPGAQTPPNTTFEFEVEVSDPTGLSTVASSTGGLLPRLDTLPPERLAVHSYDNKIRVANIEGNDLVQLTPPGEVEAHPRFTWDGTSLITFAGPSGSQVMIQNADGTDRRKVIDLPVNGSYVRFDTSSSMICYSSYGRQEEVDVTDPETGEVAPEDVNLINIYAAHVTSGDVFPLSSAGLSPPIWDPVVPKRLTFGEFDVIPTGYRSLEGVAEFTGYPPRSNVTINEFYSSQILQFVYNRRRPHLAAVYTPPTPRDPPQPPDPSRILLVGPQSATVVTGPEAPDIEEDMESENREIGMAWSGDGRHLIYIDGRTVKVVQVFSDTYNLAISSPVEVASGSAYKAWPRLSSDGSQAFYLAKEDGSGAYHLYRVAVNSSSNPVKLTHQFGGAYSYDITR